MIRLSLIITTHNRAAQLLETLESVVRQDLPAEAWECLVVDNNSTDDTATCFDAFAAAHSECRLRRVFESQPGVSHARNRGIAETEGAIVAIIDDDERIVPGFLAAYLRFFETHPDAAVAGGPIVADYPGGRPAWMSKWTEVPIANPMNFGPEVRPFPAGRVPGGGNMAFRREVIARYGAFDPSLGRANGRLIGGEETDFLQRLLRGGETSWYVPGAVMYHIIPPEKLTEDYFRRLCYHVGESQRLQARMHGRLLRAAAAEVAKWGATLLLCLTVTPRRSAWLLRMRLEISRGLFAREK